MTMTRNIIERIWPTTTTEHHHDGLDYGVVHSDRPRWARLAANYGIKSMIGTYIGWGRHRAIRAWVRVGMKLTGTEIALDEVMDDFYHDNTPEATACGFCHSELMPEAVLDDLFRLK